MAAKETVDPQSNPSIRIEAGSGHSQFVFSGSFTIHHGLPDLPDCNKIAGESPTRVTAVGNDIDYWDSSLVMCLQRIRRELDSKGVELELTGFPQSIDPLLARASSSSAEPLVEAKSKESLISNLGDMGINRYAGFRNLLIFFGETLQSLGRLFRGKAIFQRSDLTSLLWENTGRSVGIVFLISFLTGLILAFVGAIQLSKFGADLFVADLVAIAMFREMGAMMTGVILAGRTGSAFAAQIGSMKANDELNALQTMGVSAFDFIVLPRLTTLAIMMPVLAFLAALSGILGGMLVSVGFMDITATQFLTQTANAIDLNSFLSGILKSVVFGAIIAITGCFRGMAAGSSAESVGSAATSAVVTSIVLIIVADALFAVLFNIYGI